MNKIQFALVAGVALSSVVGCQFHARSPEDYSKETQALVAKKRDQIESCYTKVLESDQKAEGVVAVKFKVAPKTGEVASAELDTKATTAPEAVGQCVLDAMKGLQLDPPDQREGVASFQMTFEAKPNQG
ncbi:MAG: AgmX/PglI C-terminal domain-containing protein [Polyangiaceae bacterium]|nr:AgmX/PglI C-terminal domain-containing protein [Polyangiaceae bacterium]